VFLEAKDDGPVTDITQNQNFLKPEWHSIERIPPTRLLILKTLFLLNKCWVENVVLPGMTWPTCKSSVVEHCASCGLHLTVTTTLPSDLYCVEWDVKLYYTIPYYPHPNIK